MTQFMSIPPSGVLSRVVSRPVCIVTAPSSHATKADVGATRSAGTDNKASRMVVQ